jgi:hypothetical protein
LLPDWIVWVLFIDAADGRKASLIQCFTTPFTYQLMVLVKPYTRIKTI